MAPDLGSSSVRGFDVFLELQLLAFEPEFLSQVVNDLFDIILKFELHLLVMASTLVGRASDKDLREPVKHFALSPDMLREEIFAVFLDEGEVEAVFF